ncbi:MAG: restriction endonuclease [Defluviitaleaceae bacterium]|nr:restriction endonuclease [Defluviitaleaceae bacterium]
MHLLVSEWELTAAIFAMLIVLLIVVCVKLKRRRLKKAYKRIDRMDGHEFEWFCAEMLRRAGFGKVEVTKGSGDQGVDILAQKGGDTYAIQCKRQASNVGNRAVQEVFAGKAFYEADVGAVLTNQHFTQSAKEAAGRMEILLWDRNWLEKAIRGGGGL